MIEQLHILVLGIVLFGVGLYALLGKRNVIKIIMGIEIMTIAINVIFVGVGANIQSGGFTEFAQIFPLISMAIGAAVMAIGLAIVINNYRHARGVDSDEMATLKR